MISDALTPDLLRAYVSVCRLGSLSRAAEQAGRAQSALSMQMRRLEDLLGKRLLRRTGRGVVPTVEGEVFLSYATRMLHLGEEAVARLGECRAGDPVRIGLAEEIAIGTLPEALGRLRRAHPELPLDVVVDHSIAIADRWRDGDLDLAIATCSSFAGDAAETWDVELLWVGAIDSDPDSTRPLEIIAYAEPCFWRRRMVEALAECQRDYRVTLTSQSIAAIRSGVENGLGIALMMDECFRSETMRVLPVSAGLPAPLVVQYGLYVRDRTHAATAAAMDHFLASLRGSNFTARRAHA
ncbi:MAG: LysR family transcriptional regulator [Sphingopyxis sp.]|uniref:LysR family transcriptional regulator n=1 Tax=Sphingopyxis sp. TaxID=1908224 RepID=UPI001A2B08CB|nr:LysR substrate-binding domain-containing protein [Sphingopyxis sp.]MBJ7498602.1 LysR family transcriptional regulator [Sphingopyxis sp.]